MGEGAIDGQALRRVGAAISGLTREIYGKGPDRARVYAHDEFVFVVCEGGLTAMEQSLLKQGDSDVVRDLRVRFQERHRERILSEFEEATGHPARDVMTGFLPDANGIVCVFALAGNEDRRR